MNTACNLCIAYIYDTIVFPVSASSPIYEFVRIREDRVADIAHSLYRIQYIKRNVATSENISELLEQLDTEIDYIYTFLVDNPIISRHAGSKRFKYTHKWLQEKVSMLDLTLDTIHEDHTSGALSRNAESVFLKKEQNNTTL